MCLAQGHNASGIRTPGPLDSESNTQSISHHGPLAYNAQNLWRIMMNGWTMDIHMSHHMGKPTICICENKDADQLRGNREADQRLCFRYTDSMIPLPLKSEISSF